MPLQGVIHNICLAQCFHDDRVNCLNIAMNTAQSGQSAIKFVKFQILLNLEIGHEICGMTKVGMYINMCAHFV